MRTSGSEIARIPIISIPGFDSRVGRTRDPPGLSEQQHAGDMIYTASRIEAGCAPLRSLVRAMATENIQIMPKYLVIGIKKFAG